MNPRVKEVEILDDYQLLLTFSNHEKRIFDVRPYFTIGVFKELENKAVFSSVRAMDGTVQWINEVDFCPDTSYK